jgi:hypothetical protein
MFSIFIIVGQKPKSMKVLALVGRMILERNLKRKSH